MRMTIEYFDQLSPRVCRLIARVPGKRRKELTDAEIAKRAGLSRERVYQLSQLRSWATVKVGVMLRFRMACGVFPGTEHRHNEYLQRTMDLGKVKHGLAHLRTNWNGKTVRTKRYLAKLMA